MILLYSKADCHLCQQAYELLLSLQISPAEIEIVDITNNNALLQRYGNSIPVVELTKDHILFWPFDAEDINEALSQIDCRHNQY